METIRKIRCAYERDKKSIRQIARDFNLARNTVKKMLKNDIIDQHYVRKEQTLPKLGQYQEQLSASLAADSSEQRTALPAVPQPDAILCSLYLPFSKSYKSMESILVNGLDSKPLPEPSPAKAPLLKKVIGDDQIMVQERLDSLLAFG